MAKSDTRFSRKVLLATIIVLLFLASLLAYWWFNLVDEASEARARAIGPVEVTAKELAIAFDKDPVAADLEYDNRPLTVAGPFTRMSLGATGDPAITIGADPVFDVTAIFDKVDAPELTALPQGQPIRINCTNVVLDPTGPSLSECQLHREPLKK